MCPLKVGGFGVDKQKRSVINGLVWSCRKVASLEDAAAEEMETRRGPARLHRSDLMYRISASI